jgi:phospholipid/cholesterol/gamma-HCH transport system substrate-binding protein
LRKRSAEFLVGLFMLAGLVALLFLAFRVSGLTEIGSNHYYTLKAEFDNIGSLKPRSVVSIAGVKIGSVCSIKLVKNSFRAIVTMKIEDKYNNLPIDTSASIFTEGLLGSNYISLTPGFEEQNLKNNDMIETTHPALVLENLIGQLIYSLKSDDAKSDTKSKDKQASQSVSNQTLKTKRGV